jgi:predicted Rossmann fold nucleotide-binding protein DprA/Smf involved in DNA uptake
MAHDRSIVQLSIGRHGYPEGLPLYLREEAPRAITALGNLDALASRSVALFCSVKCPGKLILQTYDLAQQLKEAGAAVIGGFHSPMERECLNILLRGTGPIIVCPARSLAHLRIASELRKPFEQGRLLFLSRFPEKQRRATAPMAFYRNLFVAALADAIFVAYAEPHGKTETFCKQIISWRKPPFTFDVEATANLKALGAQPLTPQTIATWVDLRDPRP